MSGKTVVGIDGERFLVNGAPTYEGRSYRGRSIEGLLLNARLVQGVFDDLNPETRERFAYPDGPYDANRNTREFVAAMPAWQRAGLIGFTLNLQGGSPEGYSKTQPWENSAFDAEGALRPAFFERLTLILEEADRQGMAVILGLFYFGQDRRLRDEAAVLRAVENATDWLLEQGWRHVLVEIANEVDVGHYSHDILKAERCDELIRLVQERSGGRLLVSTSMRGGTLPPPAIMDAGDFVLLHGNHVAGPDEIRAMVRRCRADPAWRGQPILFNEDDHFDFEAEDNHFLAALGEGAGWGYFDYRMTGEGYAEGDQSVPVDWSIGSARKRGFFGLLEKVTGGG
jgi:hypothetical protein